jgi:hypothetical protein
MSEKWLLRERVAGLFAGGENTVPQPPKRPKMATSRKGNRSFQHSGGTFFLCTQTSEKIVISRTVYRPFRWSREYASSDS